MSAQYPQLQTEIRIVTTDTLPYEPVTTMFTDRIKPDKSAEYDAWSAGINGDVKRFPGFLSVDVIRQSDRLELPPLTSPPLCGGFFQCPLLAESGHSLRQAEPRLWWEVPACCL